MPVAATEVAVLSVMEPAPTLVIVVPAGMPVPETGMPTRKPVVFASGMTVPAAVCAAWAEGAAKTAEMVVAALMPAPVTAWPTVRPKVFLTMRVVPEPTTGVKLVGSPIAVRRKPMVLAWDIPATAAAPRSVWRK